LATDYRLDRKTAPALPVVAIRDVREHLRVDDVIEDYLIAGYVAAATEYLDGWTGILGRALMPQVWTLTLDAFPAGSICIPFGPLTSVVSITYKDGSGVATVMPSGDYEVSAGNVRSEIRAPLGWPVTGDYLDPVTVEFNAGTGCPEPIRIAIMMMVAGLYDGRQGEDMMTPAVRALVAPYRRLTF
jgi:uncharacterized phiE125 gp8 family phage protein